MLNKYKRVVFDWIISANESKRRTVLLLIYGYLFLTFLCLVLISLPFSKTTQIDFVDLIFLASSIVSTTGLSPIDFGGALTMFGQVVSLIFIQLGGIGYMALGSFLLLKEREKLPSLSVSLLKLEFNLPKRYPLLSFIRSVFVFTIIIEGLGTILLYYAFTNEGVSMPFWNAIFHSISAFCTAGFSLFGDSLTSFKGNNVITYTIMALSIMGSVGFIVLLDIWLMIVRRRKRITLTSRIIILSTFLFITIGSLVLFVSDSMFMKQGIEGFLSALFQLVSAHTTVGFNNYEVGSIHLGGILVIIVIMIIGASPAGTGGGVKTTSVTAVFALMLAIIRQKKHVVALDREITAQTIYLAISSIVFYIFILLIGTWSVVQIDGDRFLFEKLFFEIASALSTVGLSTGITSDISASSKLIICILMFVGRLGVMTFGFALMTQSPSIDRKPIAEDLAI